jgi:nucleotide-binding universal stress UspA family protein
MSEGSWDVFQEREPVIVVGVDGSPASRAALEFALREADRRGSSVEVVTTWSWTEPYEAMAGGATPEVARDAAERAQEQAIHSVMTGLTAIPVVSRLVLEGDPGQTLVRAARGASYLVVGHTHKGALKRALLGSVSEYCVRHASVPVMVVPTQDHAQADPMVPAVIGAEVG